MKTDKKKLYFVLCLIGLLALVIVITTIANYKIKNEAVTPVNLNAPSNEQNPRDITVLLSHDDYFYTDTIELTLTDSNAAEIYYTNDGSTPDKTKTLYEKPITLKTSKNDVNSYTIKTRAYYDDGTYSKITTHSYFIGSGVHEKFDTLVFSLSTDGYNLYDYDFGIFVTGALRDEYIATKPAKEIQPPDPANYNIRGAMGEREVYVECIESDGTEILSQNAGMRTFGGWSRDMSQKSIKLFARTEYDAEKNDFDYEFFPNVITNDGTNSKIDSYKRLVLRNSANDENFAFMRDECISEIARKAGVLDTQEARPVSVFLNGEYYGFAWAHEVYDDNYMDDNYGTEDGEYAILSGGDQYKLIDDNDVVNAIRLVNKSVLASYEKMRDRGASFDELYEAVTSSLTDTTAIQTALDLNNGMYVFGEPIITVEGYYAELEVAFQKLKTSFDYINDYNEMYAYCEEDLTDDETFSELEKLLDVDNFLMYYAFQTYIANGDWPTGNYKTYRYYPTEEVTADTPIPLDGKWRWLLFDTDFGLGLYDCQPTERSIGKILGTLERGEKSSPLLIAMLEREDMKEKFVNLMCDFMNYSLTPQSVYQIVTEKEALRLNSVTYAYKKGKTANWFNIRDLSGRVSEIFNFVSNRPISIKGQLKTAFELDGLYTVKATVPNGGEINLNTFTLTTDDKFEGQYFDGYSIKISPNVKQGFEFTSWNINGKEYFDEELTLDSSNADENSKINIVLVISPTNENPHLVISEISFNGKNDFVVLSNPYSTEVSTANLCLSDDINNLQRLVIPIRTVGAGQSIIIYCENNTSINSIGEMLAPFNLKETETLTLSTITGKIVDQIVLPNAAKNSVLIKNMINGEFYQKSLSESIFAE